MVPFHHFDLLIRHDRGIFLNPSHCLSHLVSLLKHGWMRSPHTLSTCLAITKTLNCRHFPIFWEEFLPGAADEWSRMRSSQDPGNKHAPDIQHYTVCTSLQFYTLLTAHCIKCTQQTGNWSTLVAEQCRFPILYRIHRTPNIRT